MKLDKSTMQCKKEETKLQMVQLVEKFIKEEAKVKAHAVHDVAKLVEHQKIGGEEREG